MSSFVTTFDRAHFDIMYSFSAISWIMKNNKFMMKFNRKLNVPT